MSIPQTGGGQIENYVQLVEFLEQGSKAKPKWTIGTEHEKFGYIKKNHKPLPYQGKCSIRAMLEGLQSEFNWKPVFEQSNLIGLTKNSANVSLEPGGQLELSGAPLKTIHETCNEAANHLKEVRSIASKVGAGFIGLGATPVWKHEEMPLMPKGRYSLMTEYMNKVGTHGTQMMYRTCTIQVNLDFSSESDMVKKFRVSLALQPIATALFANSPIFENQLTNHKSWRSRIWRDVDPKRTGMLPFVFEQGMGFQRYVDYALDVPMYFVFRDGKYINALGQSFRDFLKGKLPALPGKLPYLSDWADHLTTIFPEVRLKQFLEMRGADGGPWGSICALPALWVGLLYDDTSLNAAWDLCKNWNAEEREGLLVVASKYGLQGSFNGISLKTLAEDIISLSRLGLKNRNNKSTVSPHTDESSFLDILNETVRSGVTPADKLINNYLNAWNGDAHNVFDLYSY